jgi:hypothetical protein
MADLSRYTTEQLRAMLASAPSATPQSDFSQRIVSLGERSPRNAVSPKGAVSEAQVMPATIQSPGFGVKPADPNNLADVAREGADYANALKTHYGDETLAAAAYNAGPGVVDDWLNGTNRSGKNPQRLKLDRANFASQIPFPETRDYVARVTGGAQPNGGGWEGWKNDPVVAPAVSQPTGSWQNDPIVAPASQPPARPDLSKHSDAQLRAMLAETDRQTAPRAAPQVDEGLGFYAGLSHALDRAAQGAKWVANSGAVPFLPGRLSAGGKTIAPGTGDMIDNFGQLLGLQSVEKAKSDHAAYVKTREAEGKKPGFAGELGGELLGSAPTMFLGPAAGGALAGAQLGDSDTPEGVLGDASIGAAFGKLGDLALQGASRVIKPVVKPGVRMLREAGVNLTPGQILGGFTKRMEDAATSIPVVGDLITSAKASSREEFNRAAANRALAPIDEILPQSVATGHDSVRYAGDKLSEAYQNLLPRLSINPDSDFTRNIAGISTSAQQVLPRDQFQQFRKILQNNTVLNRLGSPNAGSITGTAMKEADSALGKLARQYGKSAIASEQQLGEALGNVQRELRRLTIRSNPEFAPQLNAIDYGWSQLVPLETAAGRAGANANFEAGVISPQQYQTAVRGMDPSVRNRATARGTNGDLQAFAEAAGNVLPSTMGDSGTARRLLVGRALGAGAGGYEYARGGKDLNDPALYIPAALAFGAYSPIGRRAIQATLTHDPGPVGSAIADMVSRLGRLSGPVVPALTVAANR